MKILIKLSLVCVFGFLSNITPPKNIYGIQLKDIDGNRTKNRDTNDNGHNLSPNTGKNVSPSNVAWILVR